MDSPKITVEEDETMIPIKEVKANPQGIVMSCDQSASDGFMANREKSGSLTIRVAKFAMEDITPLMNAQAKTDPWAVLLCFIIGPTPPARATHQPFH